MKQQKAKFLDALERYAEQPRSLYLLGAISYIESIFFPIPTDIFLIAYVLGRKGRGWVQATVVTVVTSVLGGLTTFAIGFLFFETIGVYIVEVLALEGTFVKLGTLFATHTVVTLFVAAFTPIPYKAFALAAGFFSVPIIPFIVASIAGRAVRFGVEAYLLHRYGDRVAQFIREHFNVVTIIIATAAILFIFLV